MRRKSIASAVAIGFFAYLLPIITAQAGCVLRGSPPICEGRCEPGETTKRIWYHGVCVTGVRVECCTEEPTQPPAADKGHYQGKHGTHLPAAPATEDKKTTGVGNAATELDTGAKQDKRLPGVGNAATELDPGATPTPSAGEPPTDQTSDTDDDGHKHKKKHKDKHPQAEGDDQEHYNDGGGEQEHY